MKPIKEFVRKENGYHIIIRSTSYTKSLEHINTLANIGLKDFTDATDIEVVYYAGRHYAKTYGVEFLTNEKPPDEYREIRQPEYQY